MPHLKVRFLLLAAAVLTIFSVLPGCARSSNLDSHISEATAAYRFHLFSWEVKTLAGQVFHWSQAANTNTTPDVKLLEARIREAFSGQGIYNPADTWLPLKFSFPPVNVYVGKPPHLLVVSPRDRIERIRAVLLVADMDEKDMEAVEDAVDSAGYSSLVVELGGMATFPTYISDKADTRFIVETAAHEWMHLYLAFTPLGFLYLLDIAGIRPDYDIATMNETVANIIGKEIGDMVYRKYYAPPETGNNPPEETGGGFDFNAAMREIRRTVDDYLARGEIDIAEAYMEQQRQYLADNGYYIRKLNQAYFAFYGTYADTPTSISPIGAEMKQLRSESASLKEFLDRVSTMTSRQDLAESVK